MNIILGYEESNSIKQLECTFKIKVYVDLVEIMVYAKCMEQATINVTFVHHEC
jgi:hypothetical protein